jgi:hypothetical protein
METKNLVDDPACAPKLAELKREFERLMKRHQGVPDRMPIDKGIINVLPFDSSRKL